MKSLFLIASVLVSSIIFSQEKTVSVYFDFDKDNVKQTFENELITIFKNNNNQVTIKGYADYFGTDDYNIKLSERRVNSVKNTLLKINPAIKILSDVGLGETKKFGERKNNRRVDIIYQLNDTKPEVKEVIEEIKIEEVKETGDTTLYQIEKLEVGANFVLEKMEFIPGEHFLQDYSKPELTKLLNVLQKFPNLKIEIQGHICCETSHPDGLDWTTGEYKLSENRAKHVYEYLISEGISKDRLSYKGFGRSKPLVNERLDNPQRNRRVEIEIVEK